MFDFGKKWKEAITYSTDMNYLNQKKSDFESLKNMREEVYNRVFKLNLDIDILNSQILALEHEFIGRIDEVAIQQRMELLKILKNRLIFQIRSYLYEQLSDNNSENHVIVANMMLEMKRRFQGILVKYKELNDVQFFDEDLNIERFFREIEIILSEFMAKEYTYGLQKNSLKSR